MCISTSSRCMFTRSCNLIALFFVRLYEEGNNVKLLKCLLVLSDSVLFTVNR
jgi:hypothetical protein